MDRNQRFLLPPDMADWLSRDHFVYFVIGLVEQLNLAGFRSAYRADGKGGAAYDPAAMVTLLAYAYCDGERSSRRIEEHCRTDIAYRLVMGGLVPDHTTISRFRDRHEKALAGIFVPVLHVCLAAGMSDVSLAAIDGSKFRCPASLRANRKLSSIEKELTRLTEEIEAELTRITAEILAESKRADLDDDTLFDPPPPRDPGTLPNITGLPKKLHGKATRRARLARAKKLLDQEHRASEVVNDQNDSAQWHPMTGRTSQNLTDAGCGQAVGLWLGDAGYCNQETLAGIGPDGPKVLLATRKEHKTRQPTHTPANDGPPPDGLSLKEKMDWELNTTAGKAAYRQRAATVEPGFGHHKHNRGILRFLRAGLSAADSEWKMINAADNIQKLYRRVLRGKATANWSTLSQLISTSPAA